MAYKNIEDARAYDKRRNRTPKRRAQRNARARERRATEPEFKASAYAATAAWEAEHREERNKSRSDWATNDRNENMEESRAYEFAREMKKYGTTVAWYRGKLIEQNGLCVLCGHLSHQRGIIQRLQVDHDHKCCDLKTKSCGKCLRGLLCADCNLLLGYLERFLEQGAFTPDPNTWTSLAIAYLESYSPAPAMFGGKDMRAAVDAVEKDLATLGKDLAEGKVPDLIVRRTSRFDQEY